jgi:hypothetical protein
VAHRGQLVNLFGKLESFFERLEIYTKVPPSPVVRDELAKIMAEVLSILAIATKGIKEGLISGRILRNYLLNSDIASQPPDIEGQALDKGSGVTVLDVLRSINDDPRKPITQREWAALNEDVRREVADAFENWVATEERCGGLRR